jgi:hypothetical protein
MCAVLGMGSTGSFARPGFTAQGLKLPNFYAKKRCEFETPVVVIAGANTRELSRLVGDAESDPLPAANQTNSHHTGLNVKRIHHPTIRLLSMCRD